jgi:serine kinase of HPr protein (carbohydrate metabolism regulator)
MTAEPEPDLPTIHGTVVAWHTRGVLLRGEPGSGKSDLALRLIAADFALVADDRVVVTAIDGMVHASPPPVLAGLIEARGVGILNLPHVAEVPLVLVVDLVVPDAVPRMPPLDVIEIAGIRLPRVSLAPFETSTPLKIAHLLAGHRVEDQCG